MKSTFFIIGITLLMVTFGCLQADQMVRIHIFGSDKYITSKLEDSPYFQNLKRDLENKDWYPKDISWMFQEQHEPFSGKIIISFPKHKIYDPQMSVAIEKYVEAVEQADGPPSIEIYGETYSQDKTHLITIEPQYYAIQADKIMLILDKLKQSSVGKVDTQEGDVEINIFNEKSLNSQLKKTLDSLKIEVKGWRRKEAIWVSFSGLRKSPSGETYILKDGRIYEPQMSVPIEEYVKAVKQADCPPNIQIKTFFRQEHLITIKPKYYAIQADKINYLLAKLEEPHGGDEEDAQVQAAQWSIEKTRLENKLSKIKMEKSDLEEDKKRLLDKVKQLENQQEKIKSEKENLVKKRYELARLKKDKERLQNRTNQLESELEKIKSRNNTNENRISELKNKVSQLERDKADIEKRAEHLEKNTEQLREFTAGLIKSRLENNLNFPLELLLPNSNKRMKFVYVKKGEFTMGLSKAEVDELLRITSNPVYTIEEIKPRRQNQQFKNGFLIGKYEVTNEEYQALIHHTSAYKSSRKPVTNLTEDEIRHFCRSLNEAYPELNIGLPTEREWEYAAKGTGRNIYTWSGKFDKNKANVESSDITEVGQKPESDSWCGASDMIGNVAEVCEPDKGNYIENEKIEEKLVSRGGSYQSNEYDCRTTSRYPLWITKKGDIGFRIVIRKKR